jgi:hypothetical protein
LNFYIFAFILREQLMRRQGFVPSPSAAAAGSADLLSGVSAWQTLLHAALLRVPESSKREETIQRCALFIC